MAACKAAASDEVTGGYSVRYGQPLTEASTTLEDFLSILMEPVSGVDDARSTGGLGDRHRY